ncbi:MAG: ketoacyl-ACP synthase III [Chitinophagaceae bacterium]|nr:MAG: ketoacyl-ACP synthase III [Chitinophagaceae bacterium]
MPFIHLDNIAITGISACVPEKKQLNSELTHLFSSKEELDKMINVIGIKERRIARADICASDLCFNAADKLLNDLQIDRSTIDVLLFMSQTGDYKIPATAPILQDKLGLSQKTICFDIGLACSGYVYALTTAAAYLNLPGIKRVLLLDGETFSKIIYEEDKTNAPLYGDAGSATLLEKQDDCPFYSELCTDGSGWAAVNIKAGGCRNVADRHSMEIKTREDGSLGSDLHVYMNGVDVFNFTMRVVPRGVKDVLQQAGLSLENIAYVIFHQANKFMTDFFAKKLKCPPSKVPYSLDRYGNTSSSTIPLTIASELREWVNNKSDHPDKKVLLSGFGAGLSWGTVVTDLSHCYIPKLLEI